MPNPHEAAFLDAFDAHADALFRHACMRLSDRERAKDATQDAYVRAWDYLVAGNEVREWRSFLYRVLNNRIIDEYRRTKELSLDALAEEGAVEAAAIEPPPSRREQEEALDTAHAAAVMRTLIMELPEPHRGALVLRYLDGLSPGEIATALEISENAASVRVHRALARLKALCKARNIRV